MPHFSTSRQSPRIRRLRPSAAPGMCPTTVMIVSGALEPPPFTPDFAGGFFGLRRLYLGRPALGAALAPIGRLATSKDATRTRATVHALSAL